MVEERGANPDRTQDRKTCSSLANRAHLFGKKEEEKQLLPTQKKEKREKIYFREGGRASRLRASPPPHSLTIIAPATSEGGGGEKRRTFSIACERKRGKGRASAARCTFFTGRRCSFIKKEEGRGGGVASRLYEFVEEGARMKPTTLIHTRKKRKNVMPAGDNFSTSWKKREDTHLPRKEKEGITLLDREFLSYRKKGRKCVHFVFGRRTSSNSIS